MFELVKDETRLADESDKGRRTLMRQTTDSEGTFNAGSTPTSPKKSHVDVLCASGRSLCL